MRILISLKYTKNKRFASLHVKRRMTVSFGKVLLDVQKHADNLILNSRM